MRRAFIAFGMITFLIYCWASVVYQNQVAVPNYKLVEVDLLGGMSRSEWDADQKSQFQRLMELESMKYQLPLDVTIKVDKSGEEKRVHVDADGNMPVDVALGYNDFAYLIANAPAGQPVKMRLRDTSAIYDLLGRDYLLRDSIVAGTQPGEEPLHIGGRALDKAFLDDLRRRGIKTITVTGHGAPVNYQLGTSLMIALIFMTLVAALKPVVWGPFIALLEKRRRELEIGAEAERQNQLEAARFEEERRRRNALLEREIQDLRLRGQTETARQAEEIIKTARSKEEEIKAAGLRTLSEAAVAASADLEQRIPELAEAIADALTPGRDASRR